MAVEKIKHALELEERVDLHEKGWKAQRILSIIFLLFLIAAAIGLFGTGPLSNEKKADNNNSIEYEKYTRYDSPVELNIHAGSISGITLVQFRQEYFNYFKLEKIVPEPNDSKVENGILKLIFKNTNDMNIDFFLKGNQLGSVNTKIKVNNSSFNVSHFIYP